MNNDNLRWINKIESYNKNLDLLQDEIIKNNDSAFAYFFSYEYNYKQHLMQKIILDNKDVKYSYLFALNIKNCDINALQKIVIDSNKINYICIM